MKKILFALFTFSLLLSGCAQKIEDLRSCATHSMTLT